MKWLVLAIVCTIGGMVCLLSLIYDLVPHFKVAVSVVLAAYAIMTFLVFLFVRNCK